MNSSVNNVLCYKTQPSYQLYPRVLDCLAYLKGGVAGGGQSIQGTIYALKLPTNIISPLCPKFNYANMSIPLTQVH